VVVAALCSPVRPWFLKRTTTLAIDPLHRVDGRTQLGDVIAIYPGEDQRERNLPRLGDEVAFEIVRAGRSISYREDTS
jgi:hypothetical protein